MTGRDRGLVMLCDVDLGFPDATRTHTVEVAQGFARAGFRVDLVARGPAPEMAGVRYAAAYAAEEQRLRRLVTINRLAIGLLWSRRHVAERFYVRDNWSCFPAILAARMLSYRVVVQVDGIPYGGRDSGNPLLSLVKRTVAIAIGRLSTGQLAVTPEIKSLLVSLAHAPPSRVAVVPNGVDLEFFSPIARDEAISRLKLDPRLRYLVFCGGLHPWSDFDGLLAAFAEVHRQRADARLILVGDGPERARVEAQATTLGIRDSVHVTGMLASRESVRDYLAAATATLLAYSADKVGSTSASPIKLTEYLAMGRAVVAFEISGLRELIQDTGAGIVVGGGSAEMAAALLGLLADGQADRYGAVGRVVAESRLSWKTVIDATLPLFESHQEDDAQLRA